MTARPDLLELAWSFPSLSEVRPRTVEDCALKTQKSQPVGVIISCCWSCFRRIVLTLARNTHHILILTYSMRPANAGAARGSILLCIMIHIMLVCSHLHGASRARRCNSYSSVARQTDILHRGMHKFVPECPMCIQHPSFTPQTAAVVLEICLRAPERLPPRALGGGIILWHTHASTGSFFTSPPHSRSPPGRPVTFSTAFA